VSAPPSSFSVSVLAWYMMTFLRFRGWAGAERAGSDRAHQDWHHYNVGRFRASSRSASRHTTACESEPPSRKGRLWFNSSLRAFESVAVFDTACRPRQRVRWRSRSGLWNPPPKRTRQALLQLRACRKPSAVSPARRISFRRVPGASSRWSGIESDTTEPGFVRIMWLPVCRRKTTTTFERAARFATGDNRQLSQRRRPPRQSGPSGVALALPEPPGSRRSPPGCW
jgi:hypothetical protein